MHAPKVHHGTLILRERFGTSGAQVTYAVYTTVNAIDQADLPLAVYLENDDGTLATMDQMSPSAMTALTKARQLLTLGQPEHGAMATRHPAVIEGKEFVLRHDVRGVAYAAYSGAALEHVARIEVYRLTEDGTPTPMMQSSPEAKEVLDYVHRMLHVPKHTDPVGAGIHALPHAVECAAAPRARPKRAPRARTRPG